MAGAPYVLVPQWNMVVKPDTVRGVQSYRTGLILDIIFGFFALLISISGFLIGGSTTFEGTIAAAAILSASSCGLVIVFIINFIVSLMSVMRMSHGVDEYGAEHARNARRGILFKWLGTTMSTLAAILVVYILIQGSTFLFAPGNSVPIQVYIPLLITAFWTAGVACKGQMYRYLVRSLQPPETLQTSMLASLLIPVLGLVGIGVVGFATAQVISAFGGGVPDVLETGRLVELMVSGVFLPPGLAVIGYFMFYWVYGKTYRRLNDSLAASPAPMVMAPAMWMAPWPAPGMMAPYAAGPSPPSAAPAPVNPAAPGGRCPRCASPLSPGVRFCNACGLQLLP